jgi:hypothetical protein
MIMCCPGFVGASNNTLRPCASGSSGNQTAPQRSQILVAIIIMTRTPQEPERRAAAHGSPASGGDQRCTIFRLNQGLHER